MLRNFTSSIHGHLFNKLPRFGTIFPAISDAKSSKSYITSQEHGDHAGFTTRTGDDVSSLTEHNLPDTQMEDPYIEPKPKCFMCKHELEFDYKNARMVSQYVSAQTGRIYPQNVTGLCDYQQKMLRKSVIRARVIGLIPVIYKDPKFINDPKLVNF